jgi:hypothetical protein
VAEIAKPLCQLPAFWSAARLRRFSLRHYFLIQARQAI